MEWIILLIGLFVGFLLGALSAVGREQQPADSVGMFFHNALLRLGTDEEVRYTISRFSYGEDGDGEPDKVPDPVLHDRWSGN